MDNEVTRLDWLRASRRATDVVPGACGGLHNSGLCDITSHDLESQEPVIEALE